MDTLGIYLSVPFCKAKCTFCNFASDAFGAGRMDAYMERLCAEIRSARQRATSLGAEIPAHTNSIYFGGGTPSLLSASHFQQIFTTLRNEFDIQQDTEITLECAPGQLEDATLEELLRQGMNRVSLGVQSFVDAEAQAVGRFHTRAMCLDEIARLRRAGIDDVGLDLIAGLPLQTTASWRYSLEQAIASEVPHLSVYMLEVDEDSRLGREVIAGGVRYHAHHVPDEDLVADLYLQACEHLDANGVQQYEISNFAREGFRSRHNSKYWTRAPYLGFGLDAHSMLRTNEGVVRFANVDDLNVYQLGVTGTEPSRVDRDGCFEEAVFLGLRLTAGISLGSLRQQFGETHVQALQQAAQGLEEFVTLDGDTLRLTARGRLMSNVVFGELLRVAA